MKQIAEEAGVSLMTVSPVLRNQSNVAPATEQLIRSIADRLGYKPNRLVRGMQSGRSGIVSAVLPAGHSIAPAILEGAYDVFHERDMIMAVDIVHGNLGEQAFAEQGKVINRLLESRVDGFLLLPVNEEADPLYFKEVVDRQIPLVFLDRDTTYFDADFVGTDDYAGGYEAARILAANGCRRPVLITAGTLVSTSRLRAEGFRAGLQALGLQLTAEIAAPNFTHNSDVIERELTPYQGQFDSIFAVADSLANSALLCCEHMQLEVPQQVKVIGFGALSHNDPRLALASFDQQPHEIGRKAAQLLLERIDEGPVLGQRATKRLLCKPLFLSGSSCPAVKEACAS